jgi:alpha-1,3-mannosyltransferase
MIKVNQQQKKKKKHTQSRDLDNVPRKTYRLQDLIKVPVQLLCNPKYFWHLAAIFLMGELVLSTFIIHKVACKIRIKICIRDINLVRLDTEIDWIAYMQEVEGFILGERDYTKLKGDTGPLVYVSIRV